jgi:hypothetical protein
VTGRWLRGVTVGAVLPALAWTAILAALQPAPHAVPTCATEDSSACVWHGGANGTGRTFTTTSDGAVTFADGQRTEQSYRERIAR